MYLNRNKLASYPKGDRLVRQIKSEREFSNPIVKYRQPEQLSTAETSKSGQIDLLNDNSTAFMLSIPLFVFAALSILKAGLQKIAKKSECGSKVACRKCYFFNNNYYLKCAVHPHRVLTKNAADCRDYQPSKIR